MGLFSFFNDWADELEQNEKKRDRETLEAEMDAYDLNDEERDLVRNHGYQPSDFEYPEDHEDMDDDDYYGEDN